MLRKISAIIIVALFCNCFTVYAQSQPEIKFKQQIVECGTNQIVKIKLTSNETLKGRITEVRNDFFTLQIVDATGQVNDRGIAYSELSKVSKVGGKKSRGTFTRGVLLGAGIYLGMAAAAAVVIGIAAAASK